MGKKPEKINELLEKCSNRELAAFSNEIKKDITPVKDAISHFESFEFVERNNNKFNTFQTYCIW